MNNNGAQVACKQLGLPYTEASQYDATGPDNARIWLDNLECSGEEDSLWNCGGNAWGDNNCGHSEDVGIVCAGDYATEETHMTADGGVVNGDIRLVPDRDDLDGTYHGRLEVFYEGQWGTVCDDIFDYNMNGAQVACRQLGLPWEDAYHYDS